MDRVSGKSLFMGKVREIMVTYSSRGYVDLCFRHTILLRPLEKGFEVPTQPPTPEFDYYSYLCPNNLVTS